ncbi:MAG TPA: hypothetical protein IAC04_05225 [Candidatus Coprenecus stercoravium]|uniref:DUF3108 domain-containing protein n=1 Tax=Candidatus Coprenecus stercoravium TaxID=2840735 RepID=A0A9D2GPM6_9BACT|nr:hypothetical protein [Candidatus Coprenecus stercoravium]
MRYLLIPILLVSAACGLSARPWFCTDGNTELVYTRYYAGDGSVKWTHTMNIMDVSESRSDSSLIVTYSSFIRTSDGKGLENMDSPAVMTAYVSPEGDVTLDIAASMVSVLRGVLWKNARITAEGGHTLLPAELTVGDTLQSAAGKVRALGMTLNVTVTDRKVLGTDTICTPAGTFPCVIVSEHKVEKGMMRNRVTTAHTWYARGIGMIRHDTYDKNMKLETSEILEKIIRK